MQVIYFLFLISLCGHDLIFRFSQDSSAGNWDLIHALVYLPSDRLPEDQNDSDEESKKNVAVADEEPEKDVDVVDDGRRADEDEHPGSSSNKENQEIENARSNKRQKKVNTNARVQKEVNHNNIIEKPRTRKTRNA